MFGTAQPKKSVVRKVSVQIPAKQIVNPSPASASAKRSQPTSKTSSPAPSSASTPRQNPKSKLPKSTPVEPKSLQKKIASAKRKAATPPPQWDDDSDSSGLDSDVSARKRIRSSASSVDPTRRLLDDSRPSEREVEEFDLGHAANLVSGDKAAKFIPAFIEQEATSIELQYPSAYPRERFYLADSLESDGFKSMDDIRETVKYICMHYLPEEEARIHADSDSGFERRLIRASNKGSKEDYLAAIKDFNDLIKKRQEDGTIAKVLLQKHSMDSDWIKRILDQVYSRTVSPHVETLREYKNGTDNVYGELLYPLVSETFKETGLRSDQIFVDLGSGVGNVVLQAALEIGCESWGCEMMPNPCELAELQAAEFEARARLWGLSVGKVRLLKDDFLENREIGEVLKRADVVLVNNQAFGPDLNSKLVDRFLDLKDGCQIVSLKSFKPEGFEIQERNVNDVRHLLKVRKLEYYSNRVSWTDAPGNYFIATKDPSQLIRFQKGIGHRLSRR